MTSENLSFAELRKKLIDFGEKPGPINDATKKFYIKKLQLLTERKKLDRFDPINIQHNNLKDIDSQPSSSQRKRRSPLKSPGNSSFSQSSDSEILPRTKRQRYSARNKNSGLEDSMDVETTNTEFYDDELQVPHSSSILETDENQDFGNMVAKKLRKYDDPTKNIIQNEILSIFIRADSGYYA